MPHYIDIGVVESLPIHCHICLTQQLSSTVLLPLSRFLNFPKMLTHFKVTAIHCEVSNINKVNKIQTSRTLLIWQSPDMFTSQATQRHSYTVALAPCGTCPTFQTGWVQRRHSEGTEGPFDWTKIESVDW